MAGLPPGDPQLVSMIVNHLKTQGLFDQFRRDCLADVDTKPAYLHLRQRVDNFVSNHLSNHTWSPQLNKNQLRNSIRQLVLQSGLLEQGVDRIVAQVVDPKVQHTFRPQVERVVRQFLSPGNHMEEEEEPAMVLDNQEVQLSSPAITSVPASDFAPSYQKPHGDGEEDMSLVEDDEKELEEEEEDPEERLNGNEEKINREREKEEESQREMKLELAPQAREPEKVKKEEEQDEEKSAGEEKEKDREEEKKASGKNREESSSDKLQIRQKARERLKEEYSLEDSDLEGLSDITVSSVHTSDLSSFDDESEVEEPPSDSTEEGEITSEDEKVHKKLTGGESDENREKKPRGSRQGYVHKPFLYSRYYSDSDDEVTVEQRRRSAAKDKEERLLKRQQNRERLEEKRRQKAAQAELQAEREKQDIQRPQAKEARKERKVLEKKVALSRKRKKESRKVDDPSTKKKSDGDPETVKKDDATKSKAICQKPVKKVSEEEQRRRKSLSEDLNEPRKILDKNRTHSFILDLEHGTEEAFRQKGVGRNERHARKEKERKENEKERTVSDDRARYKQKPEGKKGGEVEAEEKEGVVVKGAVDDKVEKKGSKLKVEKKSSVPAREGRLSTTEGSAPEDGIARDLKKEKTFSETIKEKIKGEKSLGKTDPKQQHRLDSSGSQEEKSEGEGTSDFNRKKEKQAKDILKRSKSHPEVKSLEKVKVRQEGKDLGAGSKDKSSTSEVPKHILDTKVKNLEAVPKVKSVPERARSKSRDDSKSIPSSKTDKKGQEPKGKAGAAPSKLEFFKEKKKEGAVKEGRRVSEDRTEKGRDAKSTKKTNEKKRLSEADDLSGSSVSSAAVEVVQSKDGIASQQAPLVTGFAAQQVSDSETSPVLESLTEPRVLTPGDMKSGFMDPSVSESDPTSAPQAMETVSNMEALMSTEVESNLATSESMDTESEPTAPPPAIDAASDLESLQTAASTSDLASPNVLDATTESCEKLQSQHTESNPATPPPQSSDLMTSELPPESDLENPNSSECNIKGLEPSDPDSTSASNLMVPGSLDSIPTPDLTDVQPLMSQGSDMLCNPVPTNTNSTPLPDDMYDALSDITPEPEDDDEAAQRLSESQPPRCPFPAEADALLSLMDVCASAAAIKSAPEPDGHQFESSFQDADMKMKEAALTLLSMDPDQAVSPSFIAEETQVAGQPVEPSTSEPSKEAAKESESEFSARDSEEGDKHSEASQNFGQMDSDTAFKKEAKSENETENIAEEAQVEETEFLKAQKQEVLAQEREAPVQEVAVQKPDVQEVTVQKPDVQEVPKDQESPAQGQESPAQGQESPAQGQESNAQDKESNAQDKESNAQDKESNVEGKPKEQEATAQQQETQEVQSDEAKLQEAQVQENRTQDDAQEMKCQVQVEQDAEKQVTQAQEVQEVLKVQDFQAEVQKSPDGQVHEAKAQEVQTQPARRGRPPKVVKQASSASKSDGQEEDKSDVSEVDERLEGRVTRKGRRSSQRAAPANATTQTIQEAKDTEATKRLQKNSENDEDEEGNGTHERSSKPEPAQKDALSKPEDAETTAEEVRQKEVRRGRRSGTQVAAMAKLALKRKRSDQAEEPDKVRNETAAEEEPTKRTRKDKESVTEEEDKEKTSSKERAEEEEPVKKVARRGRPSKILSNVDDSAASERKDGETETGEENEEEENKRATTRSASRLEAEKNKPSKPSTRAVSKLSGKEESSPSTRSSRSQSAAAVRGRKGESSSPTPRTRAGQKPEEPPAKRTKR